MLLLLLSSLLFATGQNSPELANLREQVRTAPTVSYCDLIRHGESYDRKIVRVRGVYLTDFEASTIASPDCDVPFSTFIGRTWVEFDSTFDELSERNSRKKIQNSKWRTGLDVVFVGRFDTHGRFGHLDMYGDRLLVMAAEQVQPLGKFSALPGTGVAPELASSNTPPIVSLCEPLSVAADQDLVRTTATLAVLNESSFLRDRSCPDQLDTLAEFSTYWRASTRPDVAKVIDQRRKKSGVRWPVRGYNYMEFRAETLDVVLEGFVMPNPFHQDLATLDDRARDITSTFASQWRAGPERVFFVQRVISAKPAR